MFSGGEVLRSKFCCLYVVGIGIFLFSFSISYCTDLGLFFSPEVELRPYTPVACLVTTFWAEYKVEVAVVLAALPVSARVLPQLLLRSRMSMTRTC